VGSRRLRGRSLPSRRERSGGGSALRLGRRLSVRRCASQSQRITGGHNNQALSHAPHPYKDRSESDSGSGCGGGGHAHEHTGDDNPTLRRRQPNIAVVHLRAGGDGCSDGRAAERTSLCTQASTQLVKGNVECAARRGAPDAATCRPQSTSSCWPSGREVTLTFAIDAAANRAAL
jgi:hypothetical protein